MRASARGTATSGNAWHVRGNVTWRARPAPPHTASTVPRARARSTDGLRTRPLGRYARGVVPVVAAAALAGALGDIVDLSDVAMMLLVAIAAVAMTLGRGPSIAAAFLAVGLLDFFFVLPFFTFKVNDLRYLVTFAVMICAAVLIGSLAERLARLAGEAEAARVRAETEELRSSILSSVSHDLRSPIGVVLGAATTLLDERTLLAPDQRTELTATIRDEASRLARLVSNLLDMSRVDAPGLEVVAEWVPVEELVGAALSRLDARLSAREVIIRVPSTVLVLVDPVLFDLVLVNLLENVLKHTPEGSPIEIDARSSADAVTIDVADRGPGIPRGSEARVFEKFVRAGGATGGVGLGLAICRGIARAHGGTITASNREGEGAVFRVTLPLRGEPPVPPIEASVE